MWKKNNLKKYGGKDFQLQSVKVGLKVHLFQVFGLHGIERRKIGAIHAVSPLVHHLTVENFI